MKQYPKKKPSSIPRALDWGWTDDSCTQYLHPDGYLTAEGLGLQCYRPYDPSGGSLFKAPSTKGTWEGWVEAAHIAADYPHIYSILYVSITSLLLPVLDIDNFGVELCARTSTGKTTALNFGLSAWGSQEDLLECWGRTPIRPRDRRFGAAPLAKDEAQLATKGLLKKWVYQSSSGGRYRRGVFLSAGESAAGKETHMEGIYARVISLHGPPFGQNPYDGGAAAEEVMEICKQHYGHLSLRMAGYMVEHHERLYPALQASYLGRFAGLISRESSGAFRRHAKYLAATQVAADLAHSLGLPSPRSSLSPLDLLFRGATDSAGSADILRRSFVELCLFLRWRQGSFVPAVIQGVATAPAFHAAYPSAEFAGIWDHESPSWEDIVVSSRFLGKNQGPLFTWHSHHLRKWEALGYVTLRPKNMIQMSRGLSPEKNKQRSVLLGGFLIPRHQYERAIEEAPTAHPVLLAQYPS